jgi:hypothetical protein
VKPMPLWSVHEVWVSREAQIAKALRDTYHQSTDELLHMCLADHAQLWAGKLFTAVTVVKEGEPRILQIVALAGQDRGVWLGELVESWREFARETGCKIMLATGRKGWKRDFKLYGFRVTKITGVCEV